MENNEIYINGVNVAGCSLYLKDNGKCLRLLTDNEPETECNAICDYGCLYHKEQLKRLEQERDELKETINTLKADKRQIYLTARKDIDELKQENEKLKDNNNHLQVIIDDGRAENKRFREENKELKEAHNEISNNSEILHENNCLRIANSKLHEDLSQTETSMQEWKKQSIIYRSVLNTIQKMILSAWEQGKYLDGGLYNDLTNEFAKIDEVLNEN